MLSWGFMAFATPPQVVARLRWARLGNFQLANGKTIRHCRLGYRTLGRLNRARTNAILWPSWFSGTSKNLLGYAGPRRMLDPRRYFIIFVDALGDGVSSSPSNSKYQPGLRFPRFSIRDMVHAEHRLAARVLHLPRLDAVMGISMGGMQSFQWAVSYPAYMRYVIPIVGSPRLTSYDRLLWRAGIEIIRHSQGFDHGAYGKAPSLPGLWDLISLNLTTPGYRVAHTRPSAFPTFVQGVEHPSPAFDADNWIRQAEAMMRLNVARSFGGSMARAAARVRAHMLIVPSAQDHMVNPLPAETFARLLPPSRARLIILNSDCGHMVPGCDLQRLNRAVNDFLAGRAKHSAGIP